MVIANLTNDDIPLMQQFYAIAREYQKAKGMRHWLQFEEDLLKKEIEEKRQWKILEEDAIGCIFMTAYEDPYIWGEKNNDPSVYIHRIVTHPDWHGNNYTSKIIDWAQEHGRRLGKKFIRMDTWGDNPKLIDYYINCGFKYIETLTPESTADLPAHYSCISLSLFEIEIV
ncbi:MAG TPA: GNAT family N-acetyltransferase [Chitinophagaceae bacterium]|jgi:GNAT superfamily N-acetyltransferase|nr:GNAT family N-acetyltransferase [Chitinophagaceae bacterium]